MLTHTLVKSFRTTATKRLEKNDRGRKGVKNSFLRPTRRVINSASFSAHLIIELSGAFFSEVLRFYCDWQKNFDQTKNNKTCVIFLRLNALSNFTHATMKEAEIRDIKDRKREQIRTLFVGTHDLTEIKKCCLTCAKKFSLLVEREREKLAPLKKYPLSRSFLLFSTPWTAKLPKNFTAGEEENNCTVQQNEVYQDILKIQTKLNQEILKICLTTLNLIETLQNLNYEHLERGTFGPNLPRN